MGTKAVTIIIRVLFAAIDLHDAQVFKILFNDYNVRTVVFGYLTKR
jgi:hypothetical protein